MSLNESLKSRTLRRFCSGVLSCVCLLATQAACDGGKKEAEKVGDQAMAAPNAGANAAAPAAPPADPVAAKQPQAEAKEVGEAQPVAAPDPAQGTNAAAEPESAARPVAADAKVMPPPKTPGAPATARSPGTVETPPILPERAENAASPAPVCKSVGTRSEGWYDASGKSLSLAQCKGKSATCRHVGTRSEGWYADETRIAYAKCGAKPSMQ
jgi:hypothetical protein